MNETTASSVLSGIFVSSKFPDAFVVVEEINLPVVSTASTIALTIGVPSSARKFPLTELLLMGFADFPSSSLHAVTTTIRQKASSNDTHCFFIWIPIYIIM
jgi:hypothetical protein